MELSINYPDLAGQLTTKRMMIIENEFELGQLVFIIADPDQRPRMVTGIMVKPGGILYQLSTSNECAFHYSIEISKEKSFIC